MKKRRIVFGQLIMIVAMGLPHTVLAADIFEEETQFWEDMELYKEYFCTHALDDYLAGESEDLYVSEVGIFEYDGDGRPEIYVQGPDDDEIQGAILNIENDEVVCMNILRSEIEQILPTYVLFENSVLCAEEMALFFSDLSDNYESYWNEWDDVCEIYEDDYGYAFDESQCSFYYDEDCGYIGTDYILPNSSYEYLTDADIASLSLQELKYARNEIYARHGRAFQSEDLKEYFGAKSWYLVKYSAESFPAELLNKIELYNIELIKAREEEFQKNYSVSSVDYILPNSSYEYLTDADIASLSLQELKYARNEIYARYGRAFQSEDLREYFGGKSWYRVKYSAESFPAELLNEIENYNVLFIKEREEALK